IEYLLNTPVNYTCSNLAEHLEGVSHDAVSDFLQRGRVTANRLWEALKPLLNNTEEAVLMVDDSVQNKQYSQQIGLVQRQYSGAEHGLVRGIDIVNLVWGFCKTPQKGVFQEIFGSARRITSSSTDAPMTFIKFCVSSETVIC